MNHEDDLERRVNEVLHARSDLSGANVKATLHGDTVLLEGTVDDVWTASRLGDAVRAIPGVAAVRNQLAAGPDLGAEAEAKDTEFRDRSDARAATGQPTGLSGR